MELSYAEKKELKDAGYISGMNVGKLISSAISPKFPYSNYEVFHAEYQRIFELIRAIPAKTVGEGKGRRYYYRKQLVEEIIKREVLKNE